MEKRSQENGLMSWSQFKQLANAHDLNCISIYLPTSRAGEEVDQKHAQVRLKNILKEVNASLDKSGTANDDLVTSLQSLEGLLNDTHFFRHQSDGLAIYLRGAEISYFTMPVHFEPSYYISDHFYLIPVLPFFNDDGTFYLLALSQQKARLFEGSRHFITEIILDDVIPDSLEDMEGKDNQQKSLQFRSSGGAKKGILYHGQGAGKDEKEKELEKYFRGIDQTVTTLLREETAPLVLACVDPHFPLYRDLSAYNNIFPEYIPGNWDELDATLLHEKSWLLVEKYFLEERETKRMQIRDLSAKGSTSYSLEEIVPASLDGRIETLFLQEGVDKFGIYDLDQRDLLRVEPEKKENNVSLFNMAATNTLIKGGRVFLDSQGKMPFKETEINALYRY